MKSIKNHFSLITALVSILLAVQIFIIVDRSIDAYKKNLTVSYSVVVVSQKSIPDSSFLNANDMISFVSELAPDSVIKRLNKSMSAKNVELLKLTLPKFYKINLKHYPSPIEVEKLKKDLRKNSDITKIESFSNTYNATYKLLLLFKGVISILSVIMIIVTVLLIFKELRIWQFKHSERMSIMSLFGAPIWLRSAVLFRLAIVDALLSSVITFGIFTYLASSRWIADEFNNIGIEVLVFDPMLDFSLLVGVSLSLSVLLASFIVIGHKEEV